MNMPLSVLAILVTLFFDANTYEFNTNADVVDTGYEEIQIQAHASKIEKDTSSIVIQSVSLNENLSYIDNTEMIKDFVKNWSTYKRSISQNYNHQKCLIH